MLLLTLVAHHVAEHSKTSCRSGSPYIAFIHKATVVPIGLLQGILLCSAPMGNAVLFHTLLVTLRAKLSGAVYCNRSCQWVCLFVGLFVFVGLL